MGLAIRKLQRIGNSTGVVIPAELLREAKMERGSEVSMHAEHGKVTLVLLDSDFDRLTALAESVISDHPNALRKLAQ